MGVQSQVVAARFMLTVGHLMSVLLVAFFIEDRTSDALADDASDEEKRAAKASLTAAVVIAILSFVMDFVGLLGGFSLFIPQVSLLQILAHFVGGICVSAFIAQEWHYTSMWAIVGTCNIPTALVEIMVLMCIFVFKTMIR